MERYQLIIFSVVVLTLFVLGFMFGEWLHTLAPSITEAFRAAWASFVDWAARFGGGDTLTVTPSRPGAIGTEGESDVPQWPVIDVFPDDAEYEA